MKQSKLNPRVAVVFLTVLSLLSFTIYAYTTTADSSGKGNAGVLVFNGAGVKNAYRD